MNTYYTNQSAGFGLYRLVIVVGHNIRHPLLMEGEEEAIRLLLFMDTNNAAQKGRVLARIGVPTDKII